MTCYNLSIKHIDVYLCLFMVIVIIIVLSKIKYKELFNDTNGLNKCDGILYINLENRTDRKELFLTEIKKINVDESKLHKVAGVYIPKNGHKGCIQSHILALHVARMNNWDTTCIIEDDMELSVSPDEFNNTVNNIFNEINEKQVKWDVILLAYENETHTGNDTYSHFVKINNATTGTFYIVNKQYIPKLLLLFEHCQSMMTYDKWGTDNTHEPYALDQKWNELLQHDNWFSSKTKLAKQRDIKSTTNNRGS